MSIPEALSTSTPEAGGDDIQQRIESRISGTESAPGETKAVDQAQPPEGDESAPPKDAGKEQDAPEEVDEKPPAEDTGIELEASEFAQLLGIDEGNLIVDEEGKVYIRTKVDGEIGKVSVDDLIRSYQTDSHVTRRSQAVAEEKRAFEAQAQQKTEELKNYLTTAAALVQAQEQALMNEFQRIDWDYLHANDPGRWAALKQEYTDQENQIAQIKQSGMSIYQAQVAQFQAKAEEARSARLEKEAEFIRTKMPEWNDPEVARQQFTKMADFASETYGFDRQILDGVEDHRLLLLVQDAMKYRQSVKLGADTAKKVVNLPKIQKPGFTRGESAVQKAATEQKRVRLRASGSTADLASLLEERLK